VPEIKDPVFAKTSQNARFLLSENERFRLVFVKTGSINSGTGNFSPAMGARIQVGIGLSHRPPAYAACYSIPDSVPGIDSSPHSGSQVFDSEFVKVQEPSARNYRPSFREDKPKTLVLYD
jgi:hypothetical protein